MPAAQLGYRDQQFARRRCGVQGLGPAAGADRDGVREQEDGVHDCVDDGDDDDVSRGNGLYDGWDGDVSEREARGRREERRGLGLSLEVGLGRGRGSMRGFGLDSLLTCRGWWPFFLWFCFLCENVRNTARSVIFDLVIEFRKYRTLAMLHR